VPVVLQPVTLRSGQPAVRGAELLSLVVAARRAAPVVRAIPQLHRVLGIR